MKVLVIENNQRLLRDIAFCLQVRYPDIMVIGVTEGAKGIMMVETETPDLVLVDSSLPAMDTLDLVSKIREFSEVPLVTLCNPGTDTERAQWLEAGADEYIIKPFSPIEFLARVTALLRRTQRGSFKPERLVTAGELTINFSTREVFLSSKRVKLTPIEYRLLSELVRNHGKVLTHATLVEKVWGAEYDHDYREVKKYIGRLRTKLERDAKNPQMFLTERGVGYKFMIPLKR